MSFQGRPSWVVAFVNGNTSRGQDRENQLVWYHSNYEQLSLFYKPNQDFSVFALTSQRF